MGTSLAYRPLFHAVRSASTTLCVVTMAVAVGPVYSDVVFDASPSVACRDVTPDDFNASHPGLKMVEARVQISSLIYRGAPGDLEELIYQFGSPERSLQVIDYLPKTTLLSDYAGNISIEQTGQQTNEVTIGASGHFSGVAEANVGMTHNSVRGLTVNYEMLPPQELVAASGTMNRGTGVYFKLRRSAQVSLEGSREFVLLLAVPKTWRGDYLRVVCEARGAMPTKTSTFLVPLFAMGDQAAQGLAEALGQAERHFLQVAQANGREVAKRSQPTLAHELSLVEPRIPADWLVRLAHRPIASNESYAFERYLPTELQQAAASYHAAKQQLHAVRGSFTAAAVPVAKFATDDLGDAKSTNSPNAADL